MGLYLNMDQIPADLPDLPACPLCGSVWVACVAHEHAARDVVCVICVDGHVGWFSIENDGDWLSLTLPYLPDLPALASLIAEEFAAQ